MEQDFFKDGFNSTLNQINSILSAETGGEYVNNIQQILEKGVADIEKAASTDQSLGIRQGFVAEEYHNLQAKLYLAREKIDGSSEVLHSRKLDSADIKYVTPDGTEDIQVKYHGSAESTLNELLHHDYTDMKKIVPWGQVGEIQELIEKKINNLSRCVDIDSIQSIEKLREIKETLASKINSDTHTYSRATSNELTNQAAQHNIDEDQFHLGISDNVILGTVISESFEAAAQATLISSVISCAPVLCKEIRNAFSGQGFDANNVFSIALNSAPKSFIRGAVSAISYNACQAEWLGNTFQNVTPAGVGALTVFALRTAENAIDLCSGRITQEQFSNQLIKDSLVTSMSYIGGIVGQTIIPIPVFGAAIGSLVGGLIASAGISGFTLFISNQSNLLITLPQQKPIIIQNYTLPHDVLNHLKLRLPQKRDPSFRTPVIPKLNKRNPTLSATNFPLLKRGLISLNKEGYILY